MPVGFSRRNSLISGLQYLDRVSNKVGGDQFGKSNPIEGLYAIGNCAGNFYGGVDYPLTVFGLNLGHNYTEGYIAGRKLAAM